MSLRRAKSAIISRAGSISFIKTFNASKGMLPVSFRNKFHFSEVHRSMNATGHMQTK